jgi:subtilisin family serine protease
MRTLYIAVFSLISSGTIAAYCMFNNSPNESTQLASSISSMSAAKNSSRIEARNLELNEALNKSSKIENEPQVMLNDPAMSQAWGLKKSDAVRAWEVSQGSKKIVVAVIDTGADIDHEDLRDNFWINPGETGKDSHGRDKATNGIDDDGNGFVDDVHGWNFVSNNSSLIDNHGHGTHIAGIIGAEAGNGKGIAGIAPKVSMMILKYYDPKVPNTDNLKNTVNAIHYAIKMKANIINYSGGGTEFSKEEHDAIEEARTKGILFVAAAGNERSNSDSHHYYPADYGLSNIISVTAIDPSTEVLSSSNYGTLTVDIAAPGQNILSTLPGSAYGMMTGTSQATAFVTGAAVLIMAKKDTFNPEEVKKYILATGDAKTSLLAKTRTARQLNLFKSLTILDGAEDVSGSVTTNSKSLRNQFVSEKEKGGKNQAMSLFGKDLMLKLKRVSNDHGKN